MKYVKLLLLDIRINKEGNPNQFMYMYYVLTDKLEIKRSISLRSYESSIGNIMDLKDGHGKIRNPIINGQHVVLKKSELDGKYIILDISNNNLYKIDANEIKSNTNKYFNVTVSHNKIYIKYKLENIYKSGNTLDYRVMLNSYLNKQAMLGSGEQLELAVDDNGYVICKGYINYNDNITAQTLIIPDFVHKIDDNAFYQCQLQKVILGKNVKIIGKQAFKRCENLKTVKFNSELLQIDDEAFVNCNIDNLEFNDKLKVIGEYAFDSNTLTEVKFGSQLKSLGKDAFINCYINKADLKNTKLISLNLNTFGIGRSSSLGGVAYIGLKELVLPKNLKYLDVTGCDSILDRNIHGEKSETLLILPDNYKELTLIDNRQITDKNGFIHKFTVNINKNGVTTKGENYNVKLTTVYKWFIQLIKQNNNEYWL